MKDICEAAGLSRGGLYTHYGSTGQVFADIIEELMSGLESQVAGKMERGLPASLILDELLERYQSEMLDRSGSLGLAFYEYYSVNRGQCHAEAVLQFKDNALQPD